MVVVPEGEFDMGSTETPVEQPAHHVVIANPFAIGIRTDEQRRLPNGF